MGIAELLAGLPGGRVEPRHRLLRIPDEAQATEPVIAAFPAVCANPAPNSLGSCAHREELPCGRSPRAVRRGPYHGWRRTRTSVRPCRRSRPSPRCAWSGRRSAGNARSSPPGGRRTRPARDRSRTGCRPRPASPVPRSGPRRVARRSGPTCHGSPSGRGAGCRPPGRSSLGLVSRLPLHHGGRRR